MPILITSKRKNNSSKVSNKLNKSTGIKKFRCYLIPVNPSLFLLTFNEEAKNLFFYSIDILTFSFVAIITLKLVYLKINGNRLRRKGKKIFMMMFEILFFEIFLIPFIFAQIFLFFKLLEEDEILTLIATFTFTIFFLSFTFLKKTLEFHNEVQSRLKGVK